MPSHPVTPDSTGSVASSGEMDERHRVDPSDSTAGPGADTASWQSQPTTVRLPQQFGRYRIVRQLGAGGMGTVFLAHDAQLDRLVALKVPRFAPDSKPDVFERFFREARAMATLVHANICPVYDVGEIDGLRFLTMAYIDGQPLSEWLERPFTCAEAVSVVRRLALALGEAHCAGIIHRDLKPSNIMVDRRGEPVIVDFGLARRDGYGDAELTQSGQVMGTPAYMPPEQILGKNELIGPACDIYSLGVILYRLLTGRALFEGNAQAVMAKCLTELPQPPSQVRDDVGPALDAICMKAVAKSPSDRYQSMAEFAAALGVLESGSHRPNPAANSLLPGFACDLFVTFAAADDEPPPGRTAGWVTTLIQNLEWRVHQLCGRTDVFKVALGSIATPGDLTNGSDQIMRQSAIVLVIMSPGYVQSVWSRHECAGLRQSLRERSGQAPTLLLVERERMDNTANAHDFTAWPSLRFWEDTQGHGPRSLGYPQPTPQDGEYYAKVDDLARRMVKMLKQLGSSAGAVPAPSKELPAALDHVPAPQSAVYVAEVTDDLDPTRDELIRYLDQMGFRILPDGWYSRDLHGFEGAVTNDLAQCMLFVQLVGAVAGKRPAGSTSSYAVLQHQCAVRARKPILQWRDPKLQLHSVVDPAHRTLLSGNSVIAVDIEQFKHEVLRHIRLELEKLSNPETNRTGSDQAFIFINADSEDVPAISKLCELLDQGGFTYALPMHQGRPDQIRQDLEANLVDCDGLIIVYGDIPEQWVREQLRLWRRVLHRREKPVRALAVYEGPPPNKHPLGMKLPHMQVIDCRQGIARADVEEFLRSVSRSPQGEQDV